MAILIIQNILSFRSIQNTRIIQKIQKIQNTRIIQKIQITRITQITQNTPKTQIAPSTPSNPFPTGTTFYLYYISKIIVGSFCNILLILHRVGHQSVASCCRLHGLSFQRRVETLF